MKRDDDEIVKDGESVRVPLCFMDATQKAIAERGNPKLTDALGKPAGQRPGYIYSTDPKVIDAQKVADAVRVTRDTMLGNRLNCGDAQTAHAAYVERISNAHRRAG